MQQLISFYYYFAPYFTFSIHTYSSHSTLIQHLILRFSSEKLYIQSEIHQNRLERSLYKKILHNLKHEWLYQLFFQTLLSADSYECYRKKIRGQMRRVLQLLLLPVKVQARRARRRKRKTNRTMPLLEKIM